MSKKKVRLFFLMIILLVVNLLFFAFFFITSPTVTQTFKSILGTKSHTVILTDEEFTPKELTINKGDTVVFATKRTAPFWPASNLHPTHDIYPAFDPQVPIEPDKTWSFTFKDEGSWKYHDHLSPYNTGLIIVGNRSTDIASKASECKKYSAQKKKQCWDNSVTTAIEQKGVEAAFLLLENFYNSDPDFARDCHGIAHNIGEGAYEQFIKRKDFRVTPKTSYCSFGFYHGFMSLLFKKSPDYKKARDFCEYVDRKLATTARDAGLQCYHGIGHGAVGTDDSRLWGDEQAMIKPALELCEKLTLTEDQLFRCASGVYNGIANYYLTGEYKLKPRTDDPLWICHLQPKKHHGSCFGNMTVTLFAVTQYNFAMGAKYIDKTIVDDKNAQTSISYLADDNVRYYISNPDYGKIVADCIALNVRLHIDCLKGSVNGFFEAGTPGVEYVKAIEFCGQSTLTEDQKNLCNQQVINNILGSFSAAKLADACAIMEGKYKNLCYSQLRQQI